MAKKPTKEQIAYGKARAGGQGAYKITAKEVKRTAKGVAKVAGLAATVAGPGKIVKAAGAVKKLATAGKASKAVKGAQASRVKTATPSAVVTREGRFTVTKTKTGKTVLTDKSGTKYTLKKGDTVQKVAARAEGRRAEQYEVAQAGFGDIEDIPKSLFRYELNKSSKKISYKKK